jgi:hypothetical protein
VSDDESLEWFADLDYNDEGKLLITKSVRLSQYSLLSFTSTFDCRKHDPVPIEVVRQRVSIFICLRRLQYSVLTFAGPKPSKPAQS